MQINDFNLSTIQHNMDCYVNFVKSMQTKNDPNNLDIRVDVKYEIPSGDVFSGGWCRPQNDGPGLRALSLIKYADILAANGHSDMVDNTLWTGDNNKLHGGLIPFDLDYISDHYSDNSCDLWEEIRSDSLFWNLYTTRKALLVGSAFATKQGDSGRASKWTDAAKQIQSRLDSHWNGNFLFEDQNRQIDGSVVHAFNVAFLETLDDTYLSVDDERVAHTVKAYNQAFCDEYEINVKDDAANQPGILYGRYPGDHYAGGNPWIVTTATLAQLFYNISHKVLHNKAMDASRLTAWVSVLPDLNGLTDFNQIALIFRNAGDSVLQRIYYHSKGANFHLAEQLDKVTGFMCSAKDLTWNYANVLSALKTRSKLNSQSEITLILE